MKRVNLMTGFLAAAGLAASVAGGCEISSAISRVQPNEHPIGATMRNWTIYAGTSPDTHEFMYTTPADAPGAYTFDQAKAYCAGLDVSAHHDWRVPTKGELNVLFNDRAEIGGLNESGSEFGGWYWSSTESSSSYEASDQRFSDGYQGTASKGGHSSLRCVRG